jgi:hypothetical protein
MQTLNWRSDDLPYVNYIAHVFIGEPVSAPDQVRSRLSPERAPDLSI